MSEHSQPTRRRFLSQFVAGAAVLPGLSASSRVRFPEGDADTEIYWEQVRAQFSFREDKVPLNAANLCPSPRSVAEIVSELTLDIDRDCSFNNRAKFGELRESSRVKVANELGVSADEIALVRNTSEANNTVNNGLALNAGDEILLWDQNHPTNNVAWDVRAARFGVKVRRVATPKHPGSESELVDTFVNAFTSQTKVLSLTHVSNVSGIRLPAKKLVEAAHARGIYVHLDGAQSWGALDVNLREIGCDSYAASGHKWYLGPKEAGLLYVKADRIESIWPNIVAPGWGDDVDPDVEGARKFESLGQRDDACLAAVGTAADFHAAIGSAQREKRIAQLASMLKAGMRSAGATLVTPGPETLSGGVVIVAVAPDNRRKVLNRLYDDFGIAGSSSGGLRLCPHVYNTKSHIQRAIEAVDAMRPMLA